MNEHPLDQLLRSHRRLEERLAELEQASVTDDGDVVREVADWFERAVKRHEDDEEQSLFPRLQDKPDLQPLLAKLAGEHRAHESLHRELRELADSWHGGDEDLDTLAQICDNLRAAYRTHINEEEQSLFPAARAALDEAAWQTIAREMDARRPNRGQHK